MSHVHRQRQQQLQAMKKAPPAQQESGGWLSGIAGALGFGQVEELEKGVQGKVEDALKTNDSLLSGGFRGEHESTGGDQELLKKKDEGRSWLDFLPTIGGEKKVEGSTGARIAGKEGDDATNYLDVASGKASGKLGGRIGLTGAEAEAELEASAALLKGAVGTGDQKVGMGRYKLGAEGEYMSATGKAKGKASLNGEGLKAGGEAEAGAYLAKAKAEGEAGFKIPFLNARLFAGGEAEGSVGVGASAKGVLEAGADGFKMGGKLGASLGLGGSLGFNFGFKKDDDKKGWFE